MFLFFDMKLVVTLTLLIKEDRGNRRGMGIEMKNGEIIFEGIMLFSECVGKSLIEYSKHVLTSSLNMKLFSHPLM